MSGNIVYSRDLLYPTENIYEPGSVHLDVLGVNNQSQIPVVLEGKTAHSPIKYLDSIIRIMQNDIFDRIFIDLKKNASLYIKADNEIKRQYGECTYIHVTYEEGGTVFTPVNDID